MGFIVAGKQCNRKLTVYAAKHARLVTSIGVLAAEGCRSLLLKVNIITVVRRYVIKNRLNIAWIAHMLHSIFPPLPTSGVSITLAPNRRIGIRFENPEYRVGIGLFPIFRIGMSLPEPRCRPFPSRDGANPEVEPSWWHPDSNFNGYLHDIYLIPPDILSLIGIYTPNTVRKSTLYRIDGCEGWVNYVSFFIHGQLRFTLQRSSLKSTETGPGMVLRGIAWGLDRLASIYSQFQIHRRWEVQRQFKVGLYLCDISSDVASVSAQSAI